MSSALWTASASVGTGGATSRAGWPIPVAVVNMLYLCSPDSYSNIFKEEHIRPAEPQSVCNEA